MPHAMHAQTPSLQAIDGRGLLVRHVSYHRARVGETAQARIERRQYDPAARPSATWDPRLSARLEANPATRPNLVSVFSLSGTPLAVESVDAGWRVSLFGEAGQPLESRDGRGSHWSNEYDEFLRPTAIHEQPEGQASRTSERFSYADNSAQAAADNLCGRLIRSDDGAGSEQVQACGITGQVLQQTRRFLNGLELPDWPEELALREALLEPGAGATTHVTYGPTGEALSQTDALGNRQAFAYGVSGQLKAISLTPLGASEQVLLHELHYNAFAQIEAQTAGNGVVSRALFDAADGRLQALITNRANSESLQHLLYGYDPVGNVISLEDRAQPTRHFSNQRIEPVNRYQHDSLYQLIEATGRETAGATVRPELPELALLPLDTSQLLNYTQHYRYDEAGNLLELKHEGAQPYSRAMQIAEDSNRSLPWQEGEAPPDFGAQFDANGNLQTLTAGQPLRWDARNRLLEVNALTRTDGANDHERYAYDAGGMRLRKTATAQAKTVQHSREVRYLPGLEIRTDSATGERLEVITLQAGRANVRYLHWAAGKPDGISDNQLRYSVDDHLGSSTLELDGEARLISHEGYYPFGGTAWWAARSAVEAKYKVVRYSGQERDASGLYYYGLRYYAPWLLRWINPDPLGDADGLNLYCMVRKNPINRIDRQGGLSIDFTDWKLYAAIIVTVIIGIAFIISLKNIIYTQQRVYLDFIQQFRGTHGIKKTELVKLYQFMLDLNADPRHIKLRHDPETKELTAFHLPIDLHRQFFEKQQTSPLFLSHDMVKSFTQIELREPQDLRARRSGHRRSMDASGLTASQAGNIVPLTVKKREGIKAEESESSEPNKAEEQTPPTASERYPIEIDDFFESTVFRNIQKKYKHQDARQAIETSIEKYMTVGGGHPHIVDNELSLDINLSKGQGHKRGKTRLYFNWNNGSWRPNRVAPH